MRAREVESAGGHHSRLRGMGFSFEKCTMSMGKQSKLGQNPEFLLSKIGNEKAFLPTIFSYYPPCPQPELVMGSPHADGGALTILQQGEVPGLPVLHDGDWVPVPPSSDHAFVVNIGVSLQIISNERFKSVLHRAVMQNTSRISIPNFRTPDRNDLLIEPAAELCSKMNPPLFKGVTFKDYIVHAVAQGYAAVKHKLWNISGCNLHHVEGM